MYLLLASLALGLSVFLTARLALVRGSERWSAERTARRANLLQPFSSDWKRGLLAFTWDTLGRFNRLPFVLEYRARIRRDNVAAGEPWGLNDQEIVALAELLFVGVTLLVWAVLLAGSGSFSPFTGLGLGAVAGFLPGYAIGHLAVQRRMAINRVLPFVLDLWVLTMEAGSSFLESIETLIESDPESPMAQEFTYFLQAVRHGKTRRTALSDMAERIGSKDLAPVIDAINTGEQLGTPVGKTLRIQAEGIRAVRTQRAEKIAAEASSKILFPTLLIMIAVLLMLMGPVIIKAVRGDLY